MPQLEFLYESRQRNLAGQRAAFAHDVAVAVGGILGEDGSKALGQHMKLLQAVADGEPLPKGDAYTENNVIVL